MEWMRRVLTDTDDDGRYRSGLGAILGACLVTLPWLFGMEDAEAIVVAALIGFIVAATWRIGEAFGAPATIISYVAFLIGLVVVLRQLPGLALFAFLGGFALTLSLLRFVGGWRNPVPATSAWEQASRPIQPILVLALVLPLLALVAVVVIGISIDRGMFH